MNRVNLIPARRLRARQCGTRVRRWLGVVPASAALLFAAYAINRIGWDTSSGSVAAAMTETEAKIKETKLRINRQKRDLREAEAMLRANRAVGEQPDWSLLMSLLASRLGEGAALTACTLEPVAPPLPSAPKGKTAQAKEPEKVVGRSELMKLTLRGVSRTQEAASRFVLGLEGSGAFDKVNLVETKRGATASESITFEIVCELSDAGANAK